MTPSNEWPSVQAVLEQALARDGVERAKFVAEACAGDDALRGQVERLLASSERLGSLFETPAAVLLDDSRQRVDLSGREVASYRLLSRLGAGGMGEVYLAHDSKLDRQVAIKFLAAEFGAQRDRLRRFHQEARAVSSLNHPHILVVHDFGELDGRPYMVTEFVEGVTLSQRLQRGPLAVREIVEIGSQIAGALAAAHARGLVHRDVKPENVMLRPDGYVKVLDFGLAKLLASEPRATDGDGTGTLRTQPGVVLGTARYMSPEQARGLDVDARSDLWSLGVLMYEMLAGRPPFIGATAADTIAAILSTEPSALDAIVPSAAAFSAIVMKAMRKDRLDRYASADDLLADLRRLSSRGLRETPPSDLAVEAGDAADDHESALSATGERRRAPFPVSGLSDYDALLERLASAVVEDAIGRIRAKDGLDRHPSADDLVADLRRLAAEPGDAADDHESTLSATGERRRATVLVSSLSDYGALVERLTSAVIEDAIGRIRAAAVDTMRRYGGIVNQSIGEEIVSLFGIPLAHEDDDLRAVRAAAELHARTLEISRVVAEPHGVHLRLQSGLHAGSVVARRMRDGPRRYALTGPPVQTASLLAAAAEPNAILVSPDCQRLVAPFVHTEPRNAVVVSADAPPITPHCVLGETGLDSRLEAAERAGLTPYSGRSAELAALRAQVELARRGEGRLVLIVGEAGSGKSRMLHELRAHVAASEHRVLQGRCRSSGGMTSYLPFVEAVHGALGVKEAEADKPAVAAVVARIRAIDGSLEPLIPLYLHLLSMPSDLFPLPRHLRGEHLQAAMLDALAAIFTCCAQRSPILLLLEDWHWADDASKQALRRLTEVVAGSPLLIAVTTRPEPGTLVDAPDPDHAARINLGPLEFTASLAIIKAVLAVQRVPEDLARRLHERTGGNPFFLEEMCQALREGGIVAAHGAEAVLSGAAGALQLPDTVQAVIRSRLDRLNPDGREVLRVASVIGREFTQRILCDAMGAAEVMHAIERLKTAGIIQQTRIVPDPVYRFKHVLTQEVTYESLLEHQRKALHLTVGRAIERSHPGSLDEPLELLAYHFSRAEAWQEAIEYGGRAADRATELSQLADALGMLEQVQSWLARLPDADAQRDRVADVLLRQERLCETLGLRGRQLQLTAELIALLVPHGASVRLGEAYLRQGDVSTLLKRFDAAERALATSFLISRECGDAALERNALRSIGMLRWHQNRYADAISITETAVLIDRQRGDDVALAADLSNLAHILRGIGDNQRALAVSEEALALPAIADDPIKRAYLVQNLAAIHRALGNMEMAKHYLQTNNDAARAQLPVQRFFHLTSLAHIQLQEGRLEESLTSYQEAISLCRRARHAEGLAQSLRMLAEVLFTIGRDLEALPHLQESAQLFAQLQDQDAEVPVRRQAAVVLERSGSPEAVAAWQRVHALARASGNAQEELAALEGIARATRATVGSTDDVVRLFEEALALAATSDRRREAALRNTLGVLQWERGAYGEALAHYEAALALFRDAGDRVHEGLTLNSIGVTLSRQRRYEEARATLEEALAVNRETGKRLLEGHTLAALGDVALALGRFDAAIVSFEESLALRRLIADRRGEGWMLHNLSRARALAGDREGAERAAREAAQVAADSSDAALRRTCGLADDEPGPAEAGRHDPAAPGPAEAGHRDRSRNFTQEEL
jgi:serine/threonine protein kinase/tetratricopeptide (TPR) repeat protein/class 3 adenylate cyclase